MEEGDPSVLRFLEYANESCGTYGVVILLADDTHFVVRNRKLLAYFDEPTPESPCGGLHVALESVYPDWLHNLVHEFAHFTQWTEQSPLWIRRALAYEGYAALVQKKKRISPSVRAFLRRCDRDLELDCDKRAAALITQWNLPLSVEMYTKYANAHIWWLTLAIEHAASGYHTNTKFGAVATDVIMRCPSTFQDNYDDIPAFFRDACVHKQ